mgnify:CR=1 FL=1
MPLALSQYLNCKQKGILFALFKNSQAGERFEWDAAHEEAKAQANSNLWTGIITLATLSILLNFSLCFYIWRQRKTRQISADSESSQPPLSKTFLEKSLEFESPSNDIKENNIRDNLVLDQKIDGKNVGFQNGNM